MIHLSKAMEVIEENQTKFIELYKSLSPIKREEMKKFLNPADTLLVNNFNKGLDIKNFYESLEPSQQDVFLGRFSREELLPIKLALGNDESENIYSKSSKMYEYLSSKYY